MIPPARVFVRQFQNGAMATMEEPFEGATKYTCAECVRSGDGMCEPHWNMKKEEENDDG